ncbi:MAG: HD-GYP domain-containing protein [Candidatus Omnitrophica bacterium]|nr:HD-GYP domain-containing protein [Candidatus Omnitrophota bacterium]
MLKGKRGLQKLKLVEKRLKSHADELTALYEVSRSITSSMNLDKMLELIVKKVATIVNADVCMIHLLNKNDLVLKTSYGSKRITCRLKGKLPLKGNVMARAVKTKMAIRFSEPRPVKKELFRSLLTVPLIEKENVIGTLTCCCKKACAYTKASEAELSLFASQAAVAIENTRLLEETKLNYLNTMKLLASVIDAKDTHTEDHSERVMRTALDIANILRLPDKQKSVLRYASMLHDIGKIGIDISILSKPAPLTREEWAQMKRHPKVGVDIIKRAGFLDDLIPAILYHHVKYSGGGYPATKKIKSKIPIEARILAIADAYEAMRSDRPYRKRMSRNEAISELKRCSGTQFDPRIVNAFLKYLNRP